MRRKAKKYIQVCSFSIKVNTEEAFSALSSNSRNILFSFLVFELAFKFQFNVRFHEA